MYYRTKIWEKIHCKYWEQLSNEINGIKKKIEVKEEINNKRPLSKEDTEDEALMEALLTYYDRFHIKDVKKNKFLSEFATKRYDVIAINRGLKIAILLSFFCAFLLKLVSLSILPRELLRLSGYAHFFIWLAIVIIFITIGIIAWFIIGEYSSILENQIIQIGRRKLNHIDIKNSISNPAYFV